MYDINDHIPPENKDILVWDESYHKFRIMFCKESDDNGNYDWFDENGYYDDSEPNITHWMELPNRPNK